MTSRTASPNGLRLARRTLGAIALIPLMALPLLGTSAQAAEWDTGWKDGLSIKSDDGQHSIKFGGRALLDFGYVYNDAALNAQLAGGSGAKFRSVRLFTSGTVYENFIYKVQVDWAGGKTALKDVYVGAKNLPVLGHVKIGHFKEPFSMEEMASSRFMTFMERGAANAFAPSRNVGMVFYDTAFDKSVTWAFGAFKDTDNGGTSFDTKNEYALTGRATWNPIYGDEGRQVVHLGVSYSHRFANIDQGGSVSYKSKVTNLVGSHISVTVPTRGADLANVELAGVLGAFSLQGEYTMSAVDTGASNRSILYGTYVEGSWFITGEHRPYERKKAVFGRVKPKKNWNPKGGGCGAWQLALRYDRLDLNDRAVAGGELQNVAAGVNWHWTSNIRMSTNYTYSDVKDVGKGHTIAFRAQVDF